MNCAKHNTLRKRKARIDEQNKIRFDEFQTAQKIFLGCPLVEPEQWWRMEV